MSLWFVLLPEVLAIPVGVQIVPDKHDMAETLRNEPAEGKAGRESVQVEHRLEAIDRGASPAGRFLVR